MTGLSICPTLRVPFSPSGIRIVPMGTLLLLINPTEFVPLPRETIPDPTMTQFSAPSEHRFNGDREISDERDGREVSELWTAAEVSSGGLLESGEGESTFWEGWSWVRTGDSEVEMELKLDCVAL